MRSTQWICSSTSMSMTCRRLSLFLPAGRWIGLGRRFGSLGVEMLGTSSAIYLLVKPDDQAVNKYR